MRHFPFLRLLKGLAVLAGLPLVLLANSAVAAPGFVQGTYLDSGGAEMSESVSYSSDQSSGDFNVIAVNCGTGAIITSVVDSEGNSYSLAAGPLANSSEGSVVSIYVAPGIQAGPNTVTVTFSGSTWSEIQIAEYAGITGVDVSTINSGNGNAQSSGSAITRSPNDILVSYVEVASSGSPTAGNGFTHRIDPAWNAGLEDKSVSSAGSYSGTWTENGATNWICAMVALTTTLSSPTPTPTPAPTPNPSPTATSGFVQGNYLDSGIAATSESVAYSSRQSAGDYNVVAVNRGTGATISSVVDSEGNSYSLAAGPFANSSGASAVSIYVAPGIKAGPNTVTVNFSGNTWSEIQVAEYAGITALDVSTINRGSGNAQSSGSATTTSANDILVSYVEISASGSPTAGNGFTKRITPSWNSGLEDRSVLSAGSYSATWSENSASNWVCAMVALKTTHSSPTPTPTPTPSKGLGSSVTLSWDANVSTNTTGYRLYVGLASGSYTTTDVGNTTTATVSNLTSGVTYYSVVTAYNSDGLESPPSNQVSYTAP